MNNNFYKCAKCKRTKPKTEFSKCTKSKQGIISRCKQCRRQDYLDTYDKYREQRRTYYKEYSLKNKGKIANKNSRYNRTHREQRNQLKQTWRKKHPLDYKRTVINGNAVRYHAVDRIRLWEIETLWQAQGAICPITLVSLTPQTATLMYIMHLSNGGTNEITNLIFTTRQVHKYKGTLSLAEFCTQAGLDLDGITTKIHSIHAKLD